MKIINSYLVQSLTYQKAHSYVTVIVQVTISPSPQQGPASLVFHCGDNVLKMTKALSSGCLLCSLHGLWKILNSTSTGFLFVILI